jgi:UDP-N-acetylglucosamine diphosphorylase/glucosamine-1-phosphate N-acetyltransferase
LSAEGTTRLVVFESPLRESFAPLSLTRPLFDLLVGSSTQLQRIEKKLDTNAAVLAVPKYLEAVCREAHPGVSVNEFVSEKCLIVNSLVTPDFEFAATFDAGKNYGEFVAIDEESGVFVMAMLESLDTRALVEKRGQKLAPQARRTIAATRKGKPPLFHYPWDIASANGDAIEPVNFTRNKKTSFWGDIEIRGNRISISESAELERFVALDSSQGQIIIDDQAIVESFSRISGPCYIGKNARIMSAKIRRGTSIGEHCKVAGEVEETIISPYSNKSHDGFIGHSVVGSWVNLGAMTTNSDLKNTYGKIKAKIGGKVVDTNSVKVGCFLGDMSKTSIGTSILAGKKIGVSSHVFGTVRDDVPSFTFANFLSEKPVMKETFIESAIETQKRMMARRRVEMTASYSDMMRTVFRLTQKSRLASRVRKGRFKID